MVREWNVTRQSTENCGGVKLAVRIGSVHQCLIGHHRNVACLRLTRINVFDQVITLGALPENEILPLL